MTRLAEHTFVRDPQPASFDLLECTRCSWPNHFCCCDPEEDDLPTYRGCNPQHYRQEKRP